MKINEEERKLLNAVSNFSLMIEDLEIPIEIYQTLCDELLKVQEALVGFINSLDKK
jgi:hypothetical protein